VPAGGGPSGPPSRVGGRLCLDFVNTLEARLGPPGSVVDHLPTFDAVVDWVADARALSGDAVRRLKEEAARDPGRAAGAHRRVLDLREALHRVLAAAVRSRAVGEADLALVNALLRDATAHHVLLPGEFGGVVDGWLPGRDLDDVVWPVVIDAWDLLTEPPLRRVKQCPGGEGSCGRLFLDTSRGGTRRWCDMRTCGNRAKVRAHYERRQRTNR